MQRALQDRGGAALLGMQVSVARGERKPVPFAHNWTDHNFHVQVQVGSHLLQDAHLLRVFPAKISRLRLHNFEELQNDSSYASKMARPRSAFQSLAQAFNVYVGTKSRRVNLVYLRGEQYLHASSGKFLDVRLEGFWVSRKIFVWTKLRRGQEKRRINPGIIPPRAAN